MPATPAPRRARLATAAVLLGLVATAAPLTATPPALATPAVTPATTAVTPAVTPAAAPTLPAGALRVDFDARDSTVRRGRAFVASGTVRPASAPDGAPGVPASFRLALTDPTGTTLATQEVTTDALGAFRTTVPGTATRSLGDDGALTLGLRALDADAPDAAPPTADAGAAAVPTAAATTGLTLTNSFVSSVGWVKPGDAYPSSVVVANPGATPVVGASVTVTAPTGSTLTAASPSAGTRTLAPATVVWTIPAVPAADPTTGAPGTVRLVLESRAARVSELDTIVWRDLSTTAVLTATGQAGGTAVAHGPKVIPASEAYDTARYGDRPFPIIPVQYTDRTYAAGHSGEALAEKINSPQVPGSTFNLYQEMSIGQLFPNGTVPSAGVATRDFTYGPGFDLTTTQVPPNTCTGTTLADLPVDVAGTALYPERITNGVYNLPGQTQYYGADSNGSAVVGSLAGVGALQNIDSGCGPTGKLVRDAAALADPEIDYSDYDTDKDGVVDFFMVVYAGCGGNGASQLGACTDAQSDLLPYDNIWPHSSSLQGAYTDPVTGLTGFTTDDQLKDLEGKPLWWTDTTYTEKTTTPGPDALKVYVRVGPYNVNPETAIDKASVISHEYGHSLGLPDFYSTGSRETYGDWNLMATDKSQDMDAYSRQELGWVVPQVLAPGRTTVTGWQDSKQDIGTIVWTRADGTPYTLTDGVDGVVHNSQMYVAKLPGRTLLDDSAFDAGGTNGVAASRSHLWWSGSGNDFGCAPTGGHNLDLDVPALRALAPGTPVELRLKSRWDIEWDFDYGYVLTTTDGGKTYTSQASNEGYTSSNTDPLAGNPNQVGCQATYDNGLTGTSGSYDAGTEVVDRKLGNTPAPVFLPDSYDISELAGAASGALRFSYATDPGLARPGWFIDDVEVVTDPGTPTEKVIYTSDFETSGGPGDPAVFNGGCREGLTVASACTQGWKYLQSGAASAQDHAYYLEMRDRSGFDLDGRGEIDRDPIGFEAGLYLAYTDEAHGYGNAGTDDPPAQSPLDSVPEPGSATPDLDDASFNATPARSTFTDAAATPHVDNYADPSRTSGSWTFDYDCLAFKVDSMSGTDAAATGNLVGDVTFDLGSGCGAFDYGYQPEAAGPGNTAPSARATATPNPATTGQLVQLSAAGTTDAETPAGQLDYSWDLGDGGPTKDAVGESPSVRYATAGDKQVTLTVTDPQGLVGTATTVVTVTGDGTGGGADTTAPVIRTSIAPGPVLVHRTSILSAAASTDDVSSSGALRYTWDRRNGGSTVDATGPTLRLSYRNPGVRRIGLTVTDEAGNRSTRTVRVAVYRYAACGTSAVRTVGDARVRRSDAALGGRYCAIRRTTPGRDALVLHFRGSRVDVVRGLAPRGGTAVVLVDGERRATIGFRGGRRLTFRHLATLRGFGPGRHRLELRRVRGQVYVEGFLVQ